MLSVRDGKLRRGSGRMLNSFSSSTTQPIPLMGGPAQKTWFGVGRRSFARALCCCGRGTLEQLFFLRTQSPLPPPILLCFLGGSFLRGEEEPRINTVAEFGFFPLCSPNQMDFQLVGFEQGEECFPLLKGVLETPENSCSLKYMLKVPPPSHKFDNVVPLDSTLRVCVREMG